ncbi:MAG TPA: TonB family protein [Candidatus Obscuribacterales bacterium]
MNNQLHSSGRFISRCLTLSASVGLACVLAHGQCVAGPLGLVKQKALKMQESIHASSTATKKGPSQPLVTREKWALLIGVGRFKDTSVKALPFAASNVNRLAAVLKDPDVGRFAPDHVNAIAALSATKDAIEKSLSENWLLKKALPEDLVFLYFCTRYETDGKDILLYAADSDRSNIQGSAISLKDLLSSLKKRTQSQQIIACLDLSYLEESKQQTPDRTTDASSAEGKESSAKMPSLKDLAKETGVTIFSGSSPGEISQDAMAAKQSYFAHYLGMALQAFNGTLPLQTVAEYVIKNVSRDTNTQQHPEFVLASENADLSTLQIGMPVKSSAPPKQLAIGHPIDELSTRRPDLLPAAPARRIAQGKAKEEKEEAPPAEAKVGDVDFGSYMARMKRHIQGKWTPPKGMEERRVVTVFTIMKDGAIVDPTVVESSGVDSVDDAALAALKAASPLEALPEGSPEYVQIKYKFDYKVKRD